MEIKNNLFNKSRDYKVTENKLLKEEITPIIKIVKIYPNYIVYIFLNVLIKKQIKIKYINDFLIIYMNLNNSNTNVEKNFKRFLYLKNLDIENIKIITSNNIISLKIPIKV